MYKNLSFCRKIKLLAAMLLVSASTVSAQSIINPVEGRWANRQMLVLDVPAGGNAFYSINGSNPETTGFAYDGPVVLDVDGEVNLRVAFMNRDGKISTKKVSYSVEKTDFPENAEAFDFVEVASLTGMIPYTCGDQLKIPESLQFSLGEPPAVWEQGTEISIDYQSVIPRNLPLSVTDGNGIWRFIITVSPIMTGLYGRKDVPFKITEWDTITFTDKKSIYKIDEEWWGQPKKPVKIDRSKNHMISWQSIEYSPENMIRFFVLPPKPDLITETSLDGVVSIRYKGEDGFKFGILDADGQATDLFETIKIDTFHGDKFKGKLVVGMFFDSVFQGTIPVEFNVNKRMPSPPVITASEEGAYVRRNVKLEFSNIENNPVYVSVTGPVILHQEYEGTPEAVLVGLEVDDFKEFRKKNLTLKTSSEGAAAYKVSAYCVDENNNKSKTVSYSVILDSCNFYLDSNYDLSRGDSDGSKARPYTSFAQLIPLINGNRFVHVRASGELKLPGERIILSSNCQIDGDNSCKLLFKPESKILVRNASLSISDCILALAEKANVDGTVSMFSLEHGVLDLNNVELSASFGKNGTVINADSSVLTVRNSGLTASADNYTSLISSVSSKISVKDSRLTTVSNTSVNFSVQGGLFELRNSTCTVSGIMGRVGELLDTHSSITDNVFNGELKKSQNNNTPVYMDSSNLTLEYDGNKSSGF